LPDAEGEADAFGVSLAAQGGDDLRIELRRHGTGQRAAAFLCSRLLAYVARR
jgi:hypothetical protein